MHDVPIDVLPESCAVLIVGVSVLVSADSRTFRRAIRAGRDVRFRGDSFARRRRHHTQSGQERPPPGSGPGLRSSAGRGVAPARSAFTPPAVRAAKPAALTLLAASASSREVVPCQPDGAARNFAPLGPKRRFFDDSAAVSRGQPSPDTLAPPLAPRDCFVRGVRLSLQLERDGGTDAVRHGCPSEHHRGSTYRGSERAGPALNAGARRSGETWTTFGRYAESSRRTSPAV